MIKPEFKEEPGATPLIVLVFSFTFTTEPSAPVLFSGDRCEHAGTVYMKWAESFNLIFICLTKASLEALVIWWLTWHKDANAQCIHKSLTT